MARPVTSVPLNGPIYRLKSLAQRPRNGDSTASSWRAGAITSRSTRPSKTTPICATCATCSTSTASDASRSARTSLANACAMTRSTSDTRASCRPAFGATETRKACASGRPKRSKNTARAAAAVRRQDRHRFHRFEDLAHAGHVPAGSAADDRGRATRTSPTGGTRSLDVLRRARGEVRAGSASVRDRVRLLDARSVPSRPSAGVPASGFNFDPSHLYWQMVDPVAFVYEYGTAFTTCTSRSRSESWTGATASSARISPSAIAARGWDFVSPGRGGVPFERIFRALNDVGYAGRSRSSGKTTG